MIGNLKEQFLYDRLPDAVINGDERGYIEAVVSGYQDRLEDVRSFTKKIAKFWEPGELPDSTTANVVLVDLISENGKSYTRSLDIQTDTPAVGSALLPRWVSRQLGVPEADLSNVRYGYDALRAVDVNTLSYLAATLGTMLHQTEMLEGAAVNQAQLELVNTWFPRLKIKGTAQSFEVLGRILGFDDVRVTPLWTRLSPRVPDDIGDPANDPDFAASPEYFPQQTVGPFYDPFEYRDGPFYSWTGTASHGTNSTQFYTETITGHNPWIDVVILGSLAGTNIPAVQYGTVVHPATGSYALAGGAPYTKAYVDPAGSSIRFQAIAEGADFNGLYVHVEQTGTLAVITVEDRLSAIKYRSSYFDLGLTARMDKIEDIFGSRGATTNIDLKDNPTLTTDGTAVSPYRPWVDGSIAVAQAAVDWLTINGSIIAVVDPRREADPAAPLFDRQLNMDEVVAAGVQTTQAFEEVRAATRLPRRSQTGILIDNEVCYAVYDNGTHLFTTTGGTQYSGSSFSTPLGGYVASVEVSFPASTTATFLATANVAYIVRASYNFGPLEVAGTVFESLTQTVVFYLGDPAQVSVVSVSPPPVGGVSLGVAAGGSTTLASEINPLNQQEYLFGLNTQHYATQIQISGSYNFATGSYAFLTSVYPGVSFDAHWSLTTTEVIRPEPDAAAKATAVADADDVQDETGWEISCLPRPEDEPNGLVYEMVDDYPWRREVVVGGELVELDSYQSGSEIAIQVLEEATAFNDQTGVDINVFGVTSPNTPHPRLVTQPRTTVPAQYRPAYLAVGYSGTLKSLSTLTSDEIELIRPSVGVSVGDTETDYDVLFQPGYALHHIGLAQGVLVADLPKFFGAHHADGLVGWFAFNEHIDDDLTVYDHSFRATPTQLSGVAYSNRVFDAERGWHLTLTNAQVVADEYRDVVDDHTLSFWIKLSAAPTTETRVVDSAPTRFTLKPGGIITGYVREASGTYGEVGSGFVGDGQWHFVYIRRTADNAIFGIGTLIASAVEANVAASYAQGDPDTDTPLYVQAYDGASFSIHDLRIWNVMKTEAEMDLVRYHTPNSTLCTYRLGFVYTLDRQDKYGIKVLPSGWAYLDVLPAWYRRTRQGLVLRYDSMGSYHGETRFKQVGIGNQRRVPDVYTLGQQFVTMVAEGTAPFSTGIGALPGWNPYWQTTNFAGNYDVLPNSGSTATGIVPVSTASGTTSPWPNDMVQTNPFRQYVFVNESAGSGVYQLSVEAGFFGSFLQATPVAHGREWAEITVDPYLGQLVTNGTVYEEFGTGFIQGTLHNQITGIYYGSLQNTVGSYGFYDPLTSTFYAKTFYGTELSTSDIPTDAYVLLSGSGTGVLLAHSDTLRGVTGSYSGSNTTPPLYMYTDTFTVLQVENAQTTWTGRTPSAAQPPVTTPDDNNVEVELAGTYGNSFVVVNNFGTILNIPALGEAGPLEFTATGPLRAGPVVLTVVSGQLGQADVDFDGFAVDINVNDTIIQRRLLRGFSGYNFKGTDSFEFTLADDAPGNFLVTFEWTNPAEDTSRGTKRQLAIFSYTLKEVHTELFRVEVMPSTAQPLITRLYTDNYATGTTPGGWFTTINSYGTQVGWEHESDIYPSNDTITAIHPIGDTLTGLTNERVNDVIYTGTDVVVADAGSFVFPTFGSVIAVPVYNPPLWFWSGALTANPSATIVARMTSETGAVRVALSETIDFGTRIYSDYVEASTANAQRAKMTVEGLNPWTTYYYAVENAGSLYTDFIGTLTTFGTGPRSFSFGVASCEDNTAGVPFAANAIWPFLHAQGVSFFMHTGDWHYYNIGVNDVNQFRTAYDEVLGESFHREFYQQHPVMYVWDDHDFGPNDSDTTSPSKPAARKAYRESVPHYALAAGNSDDGNQPVYYSFTVGRCRFIVTDCTSERTPYTVADNDTKVILSDAQLAWFKQQLLVGSADPDIGAMFWVNTLPWTGTASPGPFPPRTYWAAYPTQRAEIATFIKDNSIQKLFIVSGDQHACSFDDGRTFDFALDGTNPYPGGQFANGIPVFQAAPLAQTFSSKGTPYMIGPMVSAGSTVQQVGIVTVYDYGTNMLINFAGYDEVGTLLTSAGTAMLYTLNGTASPRP